MTGRSAEEIAQKIVNQIIALPRGPERKLVAIAGPPASGKSTVAALVVDYLNMRRVPTGFLPMDGFHYDNAHLDTLGMRERKGAPPTFDLGAFKSKISEVLSIATVSVPLFDRNLDQTCPNAAQIETSQRIVIVEGNYLLLDAPGWRDLSEHWSLSVFIEEDLEELHHRLTKRWLDTGLDPDTANLKTLSNDLPNAETVLAHRMPCDMTVSRCASS